jgi:hypothetical protein
VGIAFRNSSNRLTAVAVAAFRFQAIDVVRALGATASASSQISTVPILYQADSDTADAEEPISATWTGLHSAHDAVAAKLIRSAATESAALIAGFPPASTVSTKF